ncbi:uncharacterized protein [Leuresthes tenuis]|uniref:uncharacterized protein n=1 Tax=Leuresthes tenuis TaxID=355514 RepID=UPI003B51063C
MGSLLYGDKEEPFYREAGSSLTVGCSFNFDGSTKYFCRGKGKENVLVQTDGDRVQSGRYSIRYVEALVGGVLYVTISQLTQSDSGRYTCYLKRSGFFDGSTEFTISVTDGEFLLNQNALNVSERLKHVLSSVTDSSSTPTTVVTSASTPTTVVTSASTPTTVVTSASTPTTTQSFSSRSGSSTPSASSGTADQSVPPQKEGGTSADVLLIVGLTLVFTVALLLVALLVFCRRRSSKPLKGEASGHRYITQIIIYKLFMEL